MALTSSRLDLAERPVKEWSLHVFSRAFCTRIKLSTILGFLSTLLSIPQTVYLAVGELKRHTRAQKSSVKKWLSVLPNVDRTINTDLEARDQYSRLIIVLSTCYLSFPT